MILMTMDWSLRSLDDDEFKDDQKFQQKIRNYCQRKIIWTVLSVVTYGMNLLMRLKSFSLMKKEEFDAL